ncbi:MAG: hypothetical protein HYY63_00515, partial [Elusimicrobia bacterium]|nr:hypothetical protein [Elusimicrobiota bacterium]
QNYTAYRNAAKLQTSVTESLTVNADGSETYMGWAKPGNYYGCKELAIGGKALTVEYSYTDDGKLLSGEGQAAQGSGISETNDGFGNITRTVLDQRYTAVRDQAKLTHTVSTSETVGLDGSVSNQTLHLYYAYDAKGKLVTGENGDAVYGGKQTGEGVYIRKTFGEGTTHSKDFWGTVTTGSIFQTYEVVLGQAKLKESRTETISEEQTQTTTVTYTYNQKTGELLGAAGSGNFSSDDGFGNMTNGNIHQTYIIVGGQAKLKRQTTESWSGTGSYEQPGESLDGSNYSSRVTVIYSYYGEKNTRGQITYAVNANHKLGQVAFASGRGVSKSNDGFNNITESSLSQRFVILLGQAKLKQVGTVSQTVNADGTKSYMGARDDTGFVRGTALVVTYDYDLSTGRLKEGEGLAAKGHGESFTLDIYGNITTAVIDQKYTSVRGQAKITESKTVTDSKHARLQGGYLWAGDGSIDGSGSHSETIVYYSYDASGKLIGDNSTQVGLYGGERNTDGSWNRRTIGRGSFRNDDGFGNITEGTVFQWYYAINGAAKLAGSHTISNMHGLDGSVNGSGVRVDYAYDAYGLLVKDISEIKEEKRKSRGLYGTRTEGSGFTSSKDFFGNWTRGEMHQIYEIINGGAKLVASTTITDAYHLETTGFVKTSLDGSSNHQEVTVYYAYDAVGNMTLSGGAYGGKGTDHRTFGEGTFVTDDGWENLTSGFIAQTYEIINGAAKIKESLTATVTTEFVDSVTGLRQKFWDGTVNETDLKKEMLKFGKESQSQTLRVLYTNDLKTGKLLSASGSGTFVSTDGFGGITQ